MDATKKLNIHRLVIGVLALYIVLLLLYVKGIDSQIDRVMMKATAVVEGSKGLRAANKAYQNQITYLTTELTNCRRGGSVVASNDFIINGRMSHNRRMHHE